MSDEKKDVLERAIDFAMMRLPGQPMAMHMGTSYLVNDLATEVRNLRAERGALAKDAARYRWLRDTPTLGYGIAMIVPEPDETLGFSIREIPADLCDTIVDAGIDAVVTSSTVPASEVPDEDQFNELDAMTRAADPTPAAQPSACNHFPGQSTCEWCGAVQPERCCVDYPRCDCNSPPEPDNAPALQPCGHPWKAQHDSKCILCSSPGGDSMKDMNWPERVAYLENQLADSDRDNRRLREFIEGLPDGDEIVRLRGLLTRIHGIAAIAERDPLRERWNASRTDDDPLKERKP